MSRLNSTLETLTNPAAAGSGRAISPAIATKATHPRSMGLKAPLAFDRVVTTTGIPPIEVRHALGPLATSGAPSWSSDTIPTLLRSTCRLQPRPGGRLTAVSMGYLGRTVVPGRREFAGEPLACSCRFLHGFPPCDMRTRRRRSLRLGRE